MAKPAPSTSPAFTEGRHRCFCEGNGPFRGAAADRPWEHDDPLHLDQVLIRVQACDVCRTNLHIVDGELTPPKPPLVPAMRPLAPSPVQH